MSTARPISVALASTLTLPAAAHADAALSLDGIRFEALDPDTALRTACGVLRNVPLWDSRPGLREACGALPAAAGGAVRP